MSPLTILLIIAGIIIIITAASLAVSGISYEKQMEGEVRDLCQRAEATRTAPIPAERMSELPEPVRRYLEYAMPEEAEPLRFVRIQQTGEFRTDPAGKWMPLRAEQYFSAVYPAFIWHARIKFLPGLWISARDRYDQKEGNMLIKILSSITIADAEGPEMDLSSLHRYIGEMPWFPTAFLNEEYIRWEPVDHHSAKAVITDGKIQATVIFFFDGMGRIIRVTTDERFRTVSDRFINDPWTGYYSDYQEIGNGLKIPMEIRGEWNLSEGDFSYVRLRVSEIEYDEFSG